MIGKQRVVSKPLDLDLLNAAIAETCGLLPRYAPRSCRHDLVYADLFSAVNPSNQNNVWLGVWRKIGLGAGWGFEGGTICLYMLYIYIYVYMFIHIGNRAPQCKKYIHTLGPCWLHTVFPTYHDQSKSETRTKKLPRVLRQRPLHASSVAFGVRYALASTG